MDMSIWIGILGASATIILGFMGIRLGNSPIILYKAP
jgi:hypothetical protein